MKWLVVTLVVLCGCAAPYQKKAWWRDGGFSETQAGVDRWIVRYRGNSQSDMERVLDFSLLRAAELCSTGGYGFVEVEETQTAIEHDEEDETTVEIDEQGNEVEVDSGTSIIRTPTVVRKIRCGHARSAPDVSFPSDFLKQSIAGKYRLSI